MCVSNVSDPSAIGIPDPELLEAWIGVVDPAENESLDPGPLSRNMWRLNPPPPAAFFWMWELHWHPQLRQMTDCGLGGSSALGAQSVMLAKVLPGDGRSSRGRAEDRFSSEQRLTFSSQALALLAESLCIGGSRTFRALGKHAESVVLVG